MIRSDLHNLHEAVAAVAPIETVRGDIEHHRKVRIVFAPHATLDQRVAAFKVVDEFDPTRAFYPDLPAFIRDLSESENFNDAEFSTIHRVANMQNPDAQKKVLMRLTALSDNQVTELKRLAQYHCISLPL